MGNQRINSCETLLECVEEVGFLPFFRNNIDGFSVEEHTDSRFWFVQDQEGPWEWKGPAAAGRQCAYGKLFENRAGFVSR